MIAPQAPGQSGALYFIRDEIAAEFRDELTAYGIKSYEISPGIWFSAGGERVYWVLDYWPVETVSFQSISEGGRLLRQRSKFWAYAGGLNFRRGQLIADELRVRAAKLIDFPAAADDREYSAFTLQGQAVLYSSASPLKGKFAGGVVRFVEDKVGPPSRAYLKLWETLTVARLPLPNATDRVIDLGATPGGWSYVAASLGAKVLMVDRSEPDAALLRRFPALRFIRGDGLNPPDAELQQATIILSDMACEPQKLLQSVRQWIQLPKVRAIICTLKFHGVSDKALIREYAALPGARIYHLYHNGHELTWVWNKNEGALKRASKDTG